MFDFDEHERALLVECVRIKDRLDQLHAAVGEDVLVETIAGTTKPHPGLIEARQQALALARLQAALRMPSGDEAEGRPQRRVGVRGTYAPGGWPPSRQRRAS